MLRSKPPKQSRRELFCEALESRVLFSAAPVELPEDIPPPDDIPVAVQEATIESSDVIGHRSQEVPEPARAGVADTINFQFDYRYDSTGFFNDQARRDILEAAASDLEEWITDDLAAIDPAGHPANTWTALFDHPETGVETGLTDLVIQENNILVFVGTQNFAGGTLGEAGPGGFNATGTTSFLDAVELRGQGPTTGAGATDTAPWGGSISFDRNANWNFTFNSPGAGEDDFYTVAIHELGHVLGIGTTDSWYNMTSGSSFIGSKSVAVNNGPVALTFDGAHWVENTSSTIGGSSTVQETLFDPDITESTRKLITLLDLRGLDDIGWDVGEGNTPPVIAPIADQFIANDAASVLIPVSVTDGENDAITYNVEILSFVDSHKNAFDLDQQKNFSAFPGGDYFNARGFNEKYFQGNDGGYFILPTGDVFKWNGTVPTSTYVSTFDATFHADLNRLFDVGAVHQGGFSAGDFVGSVSGDDILIQRINGADTATGRLTVRVTASDAFAATSQTFDITLHNASPTISPIADQRFTFFNGGGSEATIPLTFSADSTMKTVEVVSFYDVEQANWDFNQAKDPSAFPGGEYLNARGFNEKYFQGNDGGYFIIPSGAVFKWNGAIETSPNVAILDTSYYEDLTKIFSPWRVLPDPATPVTATLFGNDLVVDWEDNFIGTVTLRVVSGDGFSSSEEVFEVLIEDGAPGMQPFPLLLLSHLQDTIDVPVMATDPDGVFSTATLLDSATVSEVDPVADNAWLYNQAFDFTAFPGGDYFNSRGANEKYFQSGSGNGFFILPDGSIYQWVSSIADSSFIITLDPSYHADLNKLFNAPEATRTPLAGATATITGTIVTVDPPANFTGRLLVDIDYADGRYAKTESFRLDVFNAAPVIQPIPDQRVSYPDTVGPFTLNVTDADGETPTLSVEVLNILDSDKTVYDLDRAHNFYAFPGGEYLNVRGFQEKYFMGNNGAYFIVPTGEVFQFNGTIETSTFLAKLNVSFYENLDKLFNVGSFSDDMGSLPTASISGDQLTINRSGDFEGTFTVRVTATDGTNITIESFDVLVENKLPTIDPINDRTMSTTTDFIDITVTYDDPELVFGSLDATVHEVDTIDYRAFTLDQEYDFTPFPSGDSFNARGANEKYFQATDNGNTVGFFILPDGGIYKWNGSIGTSILIATLDASYHTDLTKLFDVPEPPKTLRNDVGAGLQDATTLRIDPPYGFTGTLLVTFSVNDTVYSTHRTFALNVVA